MVVVGLIYCFFFASIFVRSQSLVRRAVRDDAELVSRSNCVTALKLVMVLLLLTNQTKVHFTISHTDVICAFSKQIEHARKTR